MADEYDPLLDVQAGWAKGPDRERLARISALTGEMIFTQPVMYEFPDIKVPTLLMIGDRDRTAIGKTEFQRRLRISWAGIRN